MWAVMVVVVVVVVVVGERGGRGRAQIQTARQEEEGASNAHKCSIGCMQSPAKGSISWFRWCSECTCRYSGL